MEPDQRLVTCNPVPYETDHNGKHNRWKRDHNERNKQHARLHSCGRRKDIYSLIMKLDVPVQPIFSGCRAIFPTIKFGADLTLNILVIKQDALLERCQTFDDTWYIVACPIRLIAASHCRHVFLFGQV
jgi:hypothetical protein